jgi:ribose/xylose/arabinose/galactoside ABC-type transport system permease subunit
MKRAIIILLQCVAAAILTPLVLKYGLIRAINMVAANDFNLQYRLNFAVSHFGTYVVALLTGLLFWLVGAIVARILGASRVPSFMTLLATLVLALGLAHLSQLPAINDLHTTIYARTFQTVPMILYPLVGALIAALLVPGKHRG